MYFLAALIGTTASRITKRSGQRRTHAASVTGDVRGVPGLGKEFPYDWQEMRVIESSHVIPIV